MKIETEQALLGQESDMPGLSLLLDEQALLDVVQLQLPAADISRIRIDYLRYKPGTGCLAGLRVFDVLGRSQHAFARVLPRDSAAWPYQSRRLALKKRRLKARWLFYPALSRHRGATSSAGKAAPRPAANRRPPTARCRSARKRRG